LTVSHLRFSVPVGAPADEVTARLDHAGDRPHELVSWFTSEDDVDAVVGRSARGWRVRVVGSAFTADVEVAVRPDGTGSIVAVDGRLAGRGMLRFASPALALAGPRIESEARRTLHREFGEPAGHRR
jgi:hypothetical protein